MKLFRLATALATTLAASIGVALVGVYLAANASARFAPDPPEGNATQLVTPPPATSTASGTSMWWFVLVAAASVLATVLVLFAVRALRARRLMPTTS